MVRLDGASQAGPFPAAADRRGGQRHRVSEGLSPWAGRHGRVPEVAGARCRGERAGTDALGPDTVRLDDNPQA
jgi:hypothetical protein